jgi:hypothetical protein
MKSFWFSIFILISKVIEFIILLIIIISRETGLTGCAEAEIILLPASFSITERVEILNPDS